MQAYILTARSRVDAAAGRFDSVQGFPVTVRGYYVQVESVPLGKVDQVSTYLIANSNTEAKGKAMAVVEALDAMLGITP